MHNFGYVLGLTFSFGLILSAPPILRFLTRIDLIKKQLNRIIKDQEFAQKTILAITSGAGFSILVGVGTGNTILATLSTLLGAFIGIKIAESSIKSQKLECDLRLKLATGGFLDSVAICVSSGMSIRKGITEAVATSPSTFREIWLPVVVDVNADTAFLKHLAEISNSNRENVMGKVARNLLISQERGTPLLSTLQSLGSEIRSETHRQLLEIAAKKDVAMMIPVVFGILPSITAIALYPAFISLANM